jgi:2-keto-4-pentenoate hydratase
MADHGPVTTELDVFPAELATLADALRTAEATRSAVPPPSSLRPDLSLGEAYRVQRRNIALRVGDGERLVGHKVGLTSLAMQRQLGVDQPDFGVITDRMVIPDGGSIDVDELVAPRLEAEFAFRFGADLPTRPSVAELAEALDGIAVAIEVIDSRVADWKITLVDTVADNASSARIVHGDFVPASEAALRSLPGTTIALMQDEHEVARGPGSAVLGDPLISLHWLASAIGEFGDRFRAGDVVLAGAVAAAVPLLPGSTWQARADGFAPVGVRSTRHAPTSESK